MRRVLLTIIALILSSAANAESSGGRFLSVLGLTINNSTLVDVKLKLGFADEFEVPDGHHETAVCYATKDSKAIVLFSTDGEFGGTKKVLLGVSVADSNEKKFPCAASTILTKDLGLDGLALGMTERELRNLLNEPSRTLSSGTLRHTFESTRQPTDDEAERIGLQSGAKWDVSHFVWGTVQGGKVTEYGAWLLETF